MSGQEELILELELDQVVLSTGMSQHPLSDQILANTTQMLLGLTGAEKPTKEELARWKQQLAGGLIDGHAKLYYHVYHKENANAERTLVNVQPSLDQAAHFVPFLLRNATWPAPELYQMLLSQISDLNNEDREWNDNLRKVIWSHNRPYVEAYLLHPQVDINKQIYDGGSTVLRECFDVLYDEAFKGGRSKQGNWNAEEAKHYATLLLERGAVMAPFAVERVQKKEGRHEHLLVVESYIAQWQAEWDDFVSGALKPESLSATQLGHFYSLGHLQEAMAPERWRGHEVVAVDFYDRLPVWAQEHQPCLDERQLMMVRMLPTPQVQSWSAAIEPAEREHVR